MVSCTQVQLSRDKIEKPKTAVAPAVGAWTPRAHGAREGRVRVWGWGGALRCLADSESLSQNKNRKDARTQSLGRDIPSLYLPAVTRSYCYSSKVPSTVLL
jgi:hypothetical protein